MLEYIGLPSFSSAIPWYRAGNAPSPVAVFQPRGAFSLADSYQNLVSRGTGDAVLGIAPTFELGRGWKFTGTQYLKSGVVPGPGYSMFILFSGVSGSNNTLAGQNVSGAIFQINPNQSSGGPKVTYACGGALSVLPELTSGSLCIAGQRGYRNGVQESGTMALWTSTTSFGIFIGANTTDGSSPLSNITAYIQMIAIWSATLSSSMVSAIHTAASAVIGKNQLICDGDSLTGGAMVSAPDRYPYQTSQRLGAAWGDAVNLGVGGATITDLLSDVATQVYPLYDSGLSKNIVSLWIGHNDLNAGSRTGAATYADISTYITGVKSAGHRVIVQTLKKSNLLVGSKETERQALNGLILANSAGADVVVDSAARPEFQDPSNTVYFSDGTHLTPAGYSIIADMICAAARTL